MGWLEEKTGISINNPFDGNPLKKLEDIVTLKNADVNRAVTAIGTFGFSEGIRLIDKDKAEEVEKAYTAGAMVVGTLGAATPAVVGMAQGASILGSSAAAGGGISIAGGTAVGLTGAELLGIGTSITSSGLGIYSAYENKKAQDEAAEKSMQEFINSVEAAITNSTWKIKDDELAYTAEKAKKDDELKAYIDAAWEEYNYKEVLNNTTSSLEAILNKELTDQEIKKLKDTTLAEIKLMNEMAKLEANTKLEKAKILNTDTAIRSAIEANSYVEATNNVIQFLDQEADSIRTNINNLKETYNIQTNEAIGQALIAGADSVTAGSSRSRSLVNAYIKADIMANTKIGEQESALDKVLAQQTRTIKDTQSKIDTTMGNARNKMNIDTKNTISAVRQVINNNKISESDKLEGLNIASTFLATTSNLKTGQIYNMNEAETKALKSQIQTNINKVTDEYAAATTYDATTFYNTDYMNKRALENNYITQMKKIDEAGGLIGLVNFYEKAPDYVKEATKRNELGTTNMVLSNPNYTNILQNTIKKEI